MSDDAEDDTETATRYRKRAEELRNLAIDMSARDIRSQLAAVAGTYERLATTLDEVAAANIAIKRAVAIRYVASVTLMSPFTLSERERRLKRP